jgi:hypothetical protein
MGSRRKNSLTSLKLPATSCGESPIVRENVYFSFSLPPPKKAGNALAVQFIIFPCALHCSYGNKNP